MNSSRKIRVGVVGVGFLGKLHAEKYSKIEGAELVGVTDTDPKRAAEIAAAFGTRAFSSHEELFGLVDAVSVVTPTESHCPVSLAFLSRGVDVLVEKPIALNTDEADRMIAEAARTGRVLQVGHLERFNAAIAALEGKVAGPWFLDALRASPFPNRSTDVDVVLDVMIHDIDIVLDVVRSPIASVTAVGRTMVSGKADMASARLTFANGCVASITASRVARDKVRILDIYQNGTDGKSPAMLSVDFSAQELSISKPSGRAAGEDPILLEAIAVTRGDSLMEELKSFVACCADRSTPPVTGEHGRDALAVAAMIQASIAENAGVART